MKYTAFFLITVLLLAPNTVLAANKPTIKLVSPKTNQSFKGTQDATVRYTVKHVDRDMVAATEVKLVTTMNSTPTSGLNSGSTYEHVVRAEDKSGEFVHDWGDPIPGRYAITTELRECNPRGCDIAPAGKALSNKSATAYVWVGLTPEALGVTKIGSNPGIFVTPKGTAIVRPPSGWYAQTVMDNFLSLPGQSGLTIVNFFDPQKSGSALISVLIGGKSEDFDLLGDKKGQIKKLKTVSEREFYFKGYPAYELVQQGSQHGYTFKMQITAIEGTSKIYAVAGISEKKDWKKYEPIINSVTASLQVQ